MMQKMKKHINHYFIIYSIPTTLIIMQDLSFTACITVDGYIKATDKYLRKFCNTFISPQDLPYVIPMNILIVSRTLSVIKVLQIVIRLIHALNDYIYPHL